MYRFHFVLVLVAFVFTACGNVRAADDAKKPAAKTRTLKTIKLVTKKNPFDPKRKRHAKWKCLTDGATVSALVAAMKTKGLSSPRTFIVNCQKMGHLKIS